MGFGLLVVVCEYLMLFLFFPHKTRIVNVQVEIRLLFAVPIERRF